jgi:DNA-directed RNA polymerase specialized sigma24 family protein
MDEEAEVFRAIYPGLHRFAAVTGPVEIDPDDLVQEAVARALARGPLSDLDDPGAYLRRTIVHLASNSRRGFARWRAAATRHGVDGPIATEYPSDLADLLALDPVDRAIVFLVDVEGRSFAEAARWVGCSPAAARQRASRARRALGHAIEEADR